jgi:enoyl reductase
MMARAVRIFGYGGPEVLEVVDIPTPVPGDGEVLIEVKAAGVNPVDGKIRRGTRAGGELPIGLGSDASGIVAAVGPGVDDLAFGDAVIGYGLSGAYASEVVGPRSQFVAKPAGVSFEQGAAIGVPVGTAYQLLKSLGIASGETILIHSGSGGVGQAAIQLAKQWGAKVVATASEPNHERLRELGAIPVSYGDGLLERVQQAAPDGIDLVLESAGTQEAIDVSLALVADRSRIGEIVNPTWAAEYGVRVYSGGLPGSMGPAEVALRRESIPYVADLVDRGEFELEIGASYPLSEVVEAHRHSDSGHVRGKIILVP